MPVDLINNYGTYNPVSDVSDAGSRTKSLGDKNMLQMDDFFSLIVAQLKNQDMYNTVDDTQFIAQMAQFSMIQALADLSELSMTTYGVSLIGKEVTIAQVGSDGVMNSFTGLVDSVNFYNGSPQVVVEGKGYSLSSVMSVKEPNIIIPTPEVAEAREEGGEDMDVDAVLDDMEEAGDDTEAEQGE
ncbi:MAG: flagellar hook capping FlgD N-terminal domain-containing protein [Anaerovoracaceae bacterium]|jgi:flagellar basal-body rod modification protein FlgD